MLTDDERTTARRIAFETARAQGLPETVADEATLRKLAELIRTRPVAQRNA